MESKRPQRTDQEPIGPEIHQRAFETWGFEAQLLALGEEAAELAAKVLRYQNDKCILADVVEEIIDVESLVASLKPNIDADWEAVRQKKRAKLLSKLENGVRRV